MVGRRAKIDRAAPRRNIVAKGSGPILLVCDAPPYREWIQGRLMSEPASRLLTGVAEKVGFDHDDFTVVNPCPPIPPEIADSKAKVSKFLAEYRDEFLQVLQGLRGIRAIAYFGGIAGQQVTGRPCSITKVRGVVGETYFFGGVPVLPMLSPNQVLARPENKVSFRIDLRTLSAVRDGGWSTQDFDVSVREADYQWSTDLSEWLEEPPGVLYVDCETVGLDTFLEKPPRLLTVQLAKWRGEFGGKVDAVAVPMDLEWWNDESIRGESNEGVTLTRRSLTRLRAQLDALLRNPSVKVWGHNFKFDLKVLRRHGFDVANWSGDTLQLAFCCDDNMQQKSLTECTKRWFPPMAGYSDEFDKRTDKGRMDLVPHDEILLYGCGDVEAGLQVSYAQLREAMADKRNLKCFQKIQMPALRAFSTMETVGIPVSEDELEKFGRVLERMEAEIYSRIMGRVPKAIQRAHLEDPLMETKLRREGARRVLSLSRDEFLRDILFSEEGMNLEPLMWTPSTKRLPPEQRLPSCSIDHLRYFEARHPICADLIEYSKVSKLRSTYVGDPARKRPARVKPLKSGKLPKPVLDFLAEKGEEECYAPPETTKLRRNQIEANPRAVYPMGEKAGASRSLLVQPDGMLAFIDEFAATGFWRHLHGGRVFPLFWLDRTVTGRTASSNPNGQNLPKRGKLAKAYRGIFVPPEGWSMVECDLSQAELRIVAWMANERRMLSVYGSGGDIHATTAAGVLGISEREFAARKETDREQYDLERFRAKAVNFGYIYGMGAAKFQVYAKTDYGIDYSTRQSEQIRENFFSTYSDLEPWHRAMRAFVKKHGYVRALHGALRRLPSVYSDNPGTVGECERQSINSPIQRFASDYGLAGLARMVPHCPEYIRLCAFVHDAAWMMVRNDKLDEGMSAVKWFMESTPLDKWFGLTPPVPLLADVQFGPSLAKMRDAEVQALQPSWAPDPE